MRLQQPEGMHDATNLERARSHNAAGRAFSQAQLVQHLGRELWQPIQTAVTNAQLPLHTFVAEHEPRTVEQAFALVLQHPVDLVHLSKPLPRRWCWGYSPMAWASVAGGDVATRDQMEPLP